MKVVRIYDMQGSYLTFKCWFCDNWFQFIKRYEYLGQEYNICQECYDKKDWEDRKDNLRANRLLKKEYEKRGYVDRAAYCEVQLPGCQPSFAVAYAHRHERHWYRSQPELLSKYEQTVLGCQRCHETIDNNKELREEKFMELRGEE